MVTWWKYTYEWFAQKLVPLVVHEWGPSSNNIPCLWWSAVPLSDCSVIYMFVDMYMCLYILLMWIHFSFCSLSSRVTLEFIHDYKLRCVLWWRLQMRLKMFLPSSVVPVFNHLFPESSSFLLFQTNSCSVPAGLSLTGLYWMIFLTPFNWLCLWLVNMFWGHSVYQVWLHFIKV